MSHADLDFPPATVRLLRIQLMSLLAKLGSWAR